jgi:putative oxidoreductase
MTAPLDTGDRVLDRQASHLHWLLRGPLALSMLYNAAHAWRMGPTPYAESLQLPVAVVSVMIGLQMAAAALLLIGAVTSDWVTRAGAACSLPVLVGLLFHLHWGQWQPLASASHPHGGVALTVAWLGIATYLLARGNQT